MNKTLDLKGRLAASILKEPDLGLSLPGWVYTDSELFALETASLLPQGWHCVGRVDQLKSAGDFFTLNLLGEPVLVVRQSDDKIAAFANVCRHRGMPVAIGEGSVKRFICSYHAWTYDLEGRLLKAPKMDKAVVDPASCGLPTYHCDQWQGFIYVCIAEQAPYDLGKALADIAEVADPYKGKDFRLVHKASEVWNTNWKCLVENFMEGYHLSVVHPRTLHGYTPTDLSEKGPSGSGFTSYFANYPDHAASRGQGAAGLTEQQRRRSFLYSVFPNQVVSQSATLLVSLSLIPVAVDQVRVNWSMSTHGEDLDEETLEQRIALWNEVNREDREKLELMQASLSSRFAAGGPLAPEDMEGTVKDFQRWYKQHMLPFI